MNNRFALSLTISILAVKFSVISQLQMDLIADYYPNCIPDEIGLEISPYESEFEAIHILHIKNLTDFWVVEKDSITAIEMSLIISIGKMDTTVYNPYTTSTYTFIKDSLIPLRPTFVFVNTQRNEMELVTSDTLYRCEDGSDRYEITLTRVSKKKMHYALYYKPHYDKSEYQELIRFGEIHLRKNRKYKPWVHSGK